MVSGTTQPRGRKVLAPIAATVVAGTLAATAPTAMASPEAVAAAEDEAGCQLVRLEQPHGGYDGGLMDIEQVDGQTVYYGSTFLFDKKGGEHQRALVWRGLDAEPVRVGPSGYEHDVAFELTPNGLVNGISENYSDGTVVAWVQDLATMELRFFDLDSGPRGADHGYSWLRRINSDGEAVGWVDRGADPGVYEGADAVAFESADSPMTLLPGSEDAIEARATGINDHGARAGTISTETYPGNDQWIIWEPVVWEADGTVTTLATPHGLEGAPRAIKDDGSVSGGIVWGEDPETLHLEAAYWPEPDVNVALGLLPGGGWSDVLGMDEGGWLVGGMDRKVRDKHPMADEGFLSHGFFWTPEVGEGTVRVLPSLFGQRKGLSSWRQWMTGSVHAVNRDLDQAGTGSHVGYRKGRAITAPTVYLNASQCGAEVETTHVPFFLAEGEEDRAGRGDGYLERRSAEVGTTR